MKIIKICDDSLCSVEDEDIIVALFLNFRRALETINRGIMINKLKNIGIKSYVVKVGSGFCQIRVLIWDPSCLCFTLTILQCVLAILSCIQKM